MPNASRAASAAADAAAPLDGAEFAALVAHCAPFENRPEIAVALSGGPDSLALTLLLKDWAAVAGGRLHAYTVDHGLRRDSAREAAEVGAFCAAQGIAHRILVWRGDKPRSGVQAAARAARLSLLETACRADGILHLFLAQHADDQAETFLLRLESGSGPQGLAAMQPVVHRPQLRLLRPLLAQPKARLIETLRQRGVSWLEDPSNSAPAYRRSVLRGLLADLAQLGLPAERFAETAAGFAVARRGLEGRTANLLARSVTLSPAGYAWLDPAAWQAAPREAARLALAALLKTLSGAAYPPRGARLDSLLTRILAGLDRGATLSGCRILPRKQGLLVCREASATAPSAALSGGAAFWDGRFRLAVEGAALAGATLGPLTAEGWKAAAGLSPELRDLPLPGAVRPSLPALRAGAQLLALPVLGWRGPDLPPSATIRCDFAPKNPLTSAPFTVAWAPMHII
ncbi:MAG: tRNA lysidine(34) synthetase TilS [Rhodovibrionaceae bacterium]